MMADVAAGFMRKEGKARFWAVTRKGLTYGQLLVFARKVLA